MDDGLATGQADAAGDLFSRVRALDTKGNPGAWPVSFRLAVAPG